MKKIISTQTAPAAIGPYSQAVTANGMVYVSGQLPIVPSTGEMPSGIAEQTRQSLTNIGEILKAAGCTYADVVKVCVLLSDIADFGAMNAVYAEFFPSEAPARVCYQVAAIPKNALVEIDVMAVLK